MKGRNYTGWKESLLFLQRAAGSNIVCVDASPLIDDNRVLGCTIAAFYLNTLRFEVKSCSMVPTFKPLGVDVSEVLAIKDVAMTGQEIFSDSQNAILIAKNILEVNTSWISRTENMPANWLAKNKRPGKGFVRINNFSPSRKCIEFHFE